jgi:hypothetical protein
MRTHRIRTLAIAVGIFLLATGVVFAFGIGNVDGVWEAVEDGGGADCDAWASAGVPAFSTTVPGIQSSGGNLTDENQVRYGDPANDGVSGCPTTWSGFTQQSGFGFNGINGPVTGLATVTPFYLGSFTHYNNPIFAPDNSLAWVDLAVAVPVDCDDNGTTDTTFTFYPRFALDETPNQASPCKYPEGPNDNGCSDQVLITQPTNPTFTCGGVPYTVNIYGFTTNANCSTVFDQNAVSTRFLTREQSTNNACLWAEISTPAADVTVAKDCLAYTSPSQNYRMAVTNLGPGSAREVTLADTFPTGVDIDPLEYTSYLITTANGTVSQGTCTALGQVLTCQLNTLLPSLTADAAAKWVVNVSFDGGPGGQVLNIATVAARNDTNTANNSDDALCITSNAVDLVSFTAVGGESSVSVAWETASESSTVGFNLYRAEGTADGAQVKLNGEIIPAQAMGSAMGATYAFSDNAVAQGVTYYYWLEDVDAAGVATPHGPVSASLIAAEAPKAGPPAVELPVLQRPVRQLPVIGLPGVQEPVIVLPVLQAPVIEMPGGTVPVPAMPAPIVQPPFTGLPVEHGAE